MAFDEDEMDDTRHPDEGDDDTPPDDDDESLTPTDDGGTIVKVAEDDDSETADDSDHYRNLTEDIDEGALKKLADSIFERISVDKKSREGRDKQYDEGIKRSGLGDEAPGGAAFVGASEAVHPMLSKATIYYQSHTINELMPPDGVVKDFIPGEATAARVEKARRKVAHMNWQFRVQMPEFRSLLERLLSQQPLGGSQYLRLIHDSRRKRPVPIFYPIDRVYIPESATDYYSAERRTFVDTISQAEFESRIRSGYYRKIGNLSGPSYRDDDSDAEKATNKVQGKDPDPANAEGMRTIWTIETMAVIEGTDDLDIPGSRMNHLSDDEILEQDPKPYVIEMDVYSREILSIVRNWEEDDDLMQEMGWGVDFEFIPWRGAQSVGLIHLIGSLAGAATGALRALLDAALVNNTQTAVMLKGANVPGQTTELQIGQITTIEGGVMGGDIRQTIMPLPFNPPSTMLYQLLGFLTEQGEDVVRTTFENLAEGSQQQPVGTTLALIEQGMKVLAAIHMRLHHAMDRVIDILARINRLYTTDEDIVDETGELLARRSDYEGPRDVIPVSDPQVFSDVQRFAQMQIVAQRAELKPDLYNRRKVEEMILKRSKIPDADQFLLPEPKIEEMNAVNENVALAFGRPVQAFPEQDHLAHIQVLLDFLDNPFLGSNPLIAQRFMTPALQHLAEHIVYWYLNHMVATVSEHAGADIGDMTKFKDKKTKLEMDKTLASASPTITGDAAKVFANIPQIIQKAQQLLQSLQGPGMGADPTALAVANVNAQVQTKKIDSDNANKAQDRQANAAKEAAAAQEKTKQTIIQESADDERTAAELQTKQQVNTDDNVTALEIAAAKIAEGKSTNISTGTGLEGHEGPGDI